MVGKVSGGRYKAAFLLMGVMIAQSRKMRLILAWFCIAAILAALLGNTRPMVDRTTVVSVDTTTLRVLFDEQEYWLIDRGMELCRPDPDRRAALLRDDPVCRQFLPGGIFRRLAISSGDELEMRLESDGSLLVRFLPCGREGAPDCLEWKEGEEDVQPRQAPNGFVRISPEALRSAGPLQISGRITLGRNLDVGGGAEFLLGGTYEIREQSLLSRLFGRRSTTIERGELIPGSEVSLLSDGEPSMHSNGHFFLTGDTNQPYLRAVALSEKGNGSLRMSLKGVEDIEIDPDWVDSIIASPIFFALAFLIGLLLNVLQLVSPLARQKTDPVVSSDKPS